MRVLIVTSSLSYGGAAKVLCFVAESLMKEGHTVAICNLEYVTGNKQPLSEHIEVFCLKAKELHKKKWKLVWEMCKIIHSFKADAIISFKSTPNLLSVIAGKLTHKPVIISERADPTQMRIDSLRKKILWTIINSADGAVFQTKGAQEVYKERLQRKSTVIANPIFDRKAINNKPEQKTIVTFGRLANRQKRYDVMLNAFMQFRETHRDYTLKIYGDGEDEQQIVQWIKELGLEGAVYMMGLSKDPIKDIQNDQIFVITSDFEGISNSMLEAMAAGFPVIATDCTPGGARMVIQDRENGLLVPRGNPEAVAHAMSEFADNDILRIRCATNAKKVVERFAPEAIAEQWNVYAERVANLNSKRMKN